MGRADVSGAKKSVESVELDPEVVVAQMEVGEVVDHMKIGVTLVRGLSQDVEADEVSVTVSSRTEDTVLSASTMGETKLECDGATVCAFVAVESFVENSAGHEVGASVVRVNSGTEGTMLSPVSTMRETMLDGAKFEVCASVAVGSVVDRAGHEGGLAVVTGNSGTVLSSGSTVGETKLDGAAFEVCAPVDVKSLGNRAGHEVGTVNSAAEDTMLSPASTMLEIKLDGATFEVCALGVESVGNRAGHIGLAVVSVQSHSVDHESYVP